MNPECRSHSLHAKPRRQQPRRKLSPPKYAAGDALHGQISPDINLVTATEIFSMDTSLITTATKDQCRVETKFNDSSYGNPNIRKVCSFSNDSLQNGVSVVDNDFASLRGMPSPRLTKNNDEYARSASKQRKIENNSYCNTSLSKETPCRECSIDTPGANNHESLTDKKRATSGHSELTEGIAMSEKGGDLRHTSDNYSVDKYHSPDRKLSMFSAEIWTEKVLPNDTFVCPEPELVEIYFDTNKRTNSFNRFGNCSTESIEMTTVRRDSSCGVLERNISANSALSARKSRPLSSGQKKINFDDEIWPICPKLIPSGKDSSISVLENKYEAISPEKLNENCENVAAKSHLRCSPLKSAIFEVPLRSGMKQHDLEDCSTNEKMIEPTHEIDGQIDVDSRSDTKKLSNNISRSPISQASAAALEKPQRFVEADRISGLSGPVLNLLGQTQNSNLQDEIPNSETSVKSRTGLEMKEVKKKCRIDYESNQTRTLKENPLSVSNSEPVSIVREDILNQSVSVLYGTKSAATKCDEIISLDEIELQRNREDCSSSFPAKNRDNVYNHFEETFSTPTDIMCAISLKLDELPKSSTLSLKNKINGKSVELSSRNGTVSREIHALESCVRPLSSSSKLSARELKDTQNNIDNQEIKKKRKCVKVVRFKTCGKRDGTKINSTVIRQPEDFVNYETEQAQSKVHSGFNSINDTPNSTSAQNFTLEINQMSKEIARQIEMDPAPDDAVDSLAKIEIIMEANRQKAERLQQLQPDVLLPRLTPPDAGKSLAKALIRCRNYMQSNEYSIDSTNTVNKLLTSSVRSLRQTVERQKLALAVQEERCGTSTNRRKSKKSRHENGVNARRVSTADEWGASQVQCLISDIFTLTEKIVPKLNGNEIQKKSLVISNFSHDSITDFTISKNTTAPTDATRAKTDSTSFVTELKTSLETDSSRATHSLGTPKTIETSAEKPMVISEAFSNHRIGSNQNNLQNRGYQKADKKSETIESSISPSTFSRKVASIEPTKTLKKLFNELWENRSKTLSRYSDVNDSTINFRSGIHNATMNQKLPVWKPGGNIFVQPSINAIQNNQKSRAPPSSINKKKYITSEHTRDSKTHQRAKAISGTIKDPSKISQKPIIKPYNTTSFAKIKAVPAKEHQSEVMSLGRSKVQIASEVEARKPRSKSRTRTRTPNKISRVAVTKIPLEHTDNGFSVTEQKTPVANKLPSSKKSSSTPKDIIQMLEELIKCSDNGTSIHNASPVQQVARCTVIVKDVNEVGTNSAPLKIEAKSLITNNSSLSNERGDRRAENVSQNQSNHSTSDREITEKSKNTADVNDDEILINDEKPSLDEDTLTESYNVHKELDSISVMNVEESFPVSRSSSEVYSNGFTERRNIPSVSNVSCTAELSSDNSVKSSVSIKWCQVSLTSLPSHQISEGLISSKMSDTEIASCRGKMQKDSEESYDSIEDDEVTYDSFAQQLQKDRNVLASNGVAPKKKIANRHARSLEMLKEILSDQGLGIHFLSKAENELRSGCRCGLSKRRLAARRSLQGANFITPKISGETIHRISLPDRNCSAPFFSKLATLSESENNLNHADVSTMTSVDNSTITMNDYSTSDKFDFHCSKVENILLNKIITVENATQIDITSKSDMCVGDGMICETSAPLIAGNLEIRTENSAALYTSSATCTPLNFSHEKFVVHEKESFQYKLPNEISEAFKLAAIRANNLYEAVRVLRENIPSEGVIQSNLAVKTVSSQILTGVPTASSLSAFSENLPYDDRIKSGHVRSSNKSLSTFRSIKSPEELTNSTHVPPVRIIIPRIRMKTNDETDCTEPAQGSTKESPRRKLTGENVTTFEESDRNTTGDILQTKLDNVDPTKPLVLPKPILVNREAFGTTVEKQQLVKERSIDSTQVPTSENRFPSNAQISRSGTLLRKNGCQSPISSQQNLVRATVNEKRIETLHFAGAQTASVVGSDSNTGSGEIITEYSTKSQNANFVSDGSLEAAKEIRGSLTGSHIKTLLEKNLQYFEIDYNPMVDGKVFEHFGEQLLTEMSDDEVSTNKVFAETTTSISCTHLDDCNIISDVQNVVRHLLNEIEENGESSTITKQYDLNTHIPRHRCVKKPVRRLNLERTKKLVNHDKRSPFCGKYWKILSGLIVSREHLLSMIYAAICIFIFCCLQFSVRCEVH